MPDRAGPKTTFMHGGDADDHHRVRCDNLREQLKWMAIEDPWRDPAMLPPRAVVYQQHLALVEIERQRFIEFFDLQQHQATMADGEFEAYTVRLAWEGWLGATVGFRRADYRGQLCSTHQQEMPCSDCQDDYEQMRRDDANGYINRG